MVEQLAWHEWGEETFAEARRLERPVILLLYASWCRFSRRMETELADPRLATILSERFLLVRVDKDRRPEVNDRYNMGGWPSLCLLTPAGELITGGTSYTAEQLEDLLARADRLWAEHSERIVARLEESIERERQKEEERALRAGEITPSIVQKVRKAVLEEFDETYGGFGSGQKFPHSESIDFVLLLFVQTGDESLKRVALETLRQMAESPLHDTIDGGFFRYSTTRDWRSPHTEKLLETNVGLLRNYLEAYQIFDRAEFREVAEKIVGYMRDHLRLKGRPAFGGSQDSADQYYAMSAADRASSARPPVDETIYVNWNAAAVSALFKASAVLGDRSCYEMAEETLEFLIEECYDAGRGMYHYHDGNSRHILGLLSDQAYAARALVHATQYTGERRYLEVVEDLLQILVSKQVGSHGGFYDIRVESGAVGGLQRRNQSILENGLIAEVYLRAHYLTGKPEYLETAQRTLRLFAEDYHLYGYFTAGYARAVDLVLRPPVHAVIVGDREDDATIALAARASGLYLPSKLVQVIDPEQDRDLLARFELPTDPRPIAYVTVGGAHVARVTDPDELAKAMSRYERRDSDGET